MPHYFRECVCLTEAEETVTFISNILGGGARRDFSVYPCLLWNSFCRSEVQLMRSACFGLQSAGVKGVHYHTIMTDHPKVRNSTVRNSGPSTVRPTNPSPCLLMHLCKCYFAIKVTLKPLWLKFTRALLFSQTQNPPSIH